MNNTINFSKQINVINEIMNEYIAINDARNEHNPNLSNIMIR